jgi:hypothetical protein
MRSLLDAAKEYAQDRAEHHGDIKIAVVQSTDGFHIIGVHKHNDTKPVATYLCAVYDLETQGEVEVRNGIDKVVKAIIT